MNFPRPAGRPAIGGREDDFHRPATVRSGNDRPLRRGSPLTRRSREYPVLIPAALNGGIAREHARQKRAIGTNARSESKAYARRVLNSPADCSLTVRLQGK